MVLSVEVARSLAARIRLGETDPRWGMSSWMYVPPYNTDGTPGTVDVLGITFSRKTYDAWHKSNPHWISRHRDKGMLHFLENYNGLPGSQDQ